MFATRQAREMLESLNPEKAEPLFPTPALVRIVTLGNRWCDSIFLRGHIACAQMRTQERIC